MTSSLGKFDHRGNFKIESSVDAEICLNNGHPCPYLCQSIFSLCHYRWGSPSGPIPKNCPLRLESEMAFLFWKEDLVEGCLS